MTVSHIEASKIKEYLVAEILYLTSNCEEFVALQNNYFSSLIILQFVIVSSVCINIHPISNCAYISYWVALKTAFLCENTVGLGNYRADFKFCYLDLKIGTVMEIIEGFCPANTWELI